MNQDPVIHVACNIDSNYVKYCAVMLTSLLENNRDSWFWIHIISSGLEERDMAVIRSVVIDKYGQQLSFHVAPETLLESCKVDEA
ncbi:MAG: hypothetical protein K2L31_05255 [Muribaculum sp.]|nr:hypothetical protein [Muribaculum sp.]